MDAPAFFVSKSTGTLSLAVVIENLDRLARMVPVHDDLPDACPLPASPVAPGPRPPREAGAALRPEQIPTRSGSFRP